MAPSAYVVEALGQYALMFALDRGKVPSPRHLVRAGLRLQSVALALRTTVYRSPMRLPEVSRLRLEAYREAGHFGSDKAFAVNHVALFDTWDEVSGASETIVARLRGRAVGTVRLAYPMGPNAALPLMTYIPAAQTFWPDRSRIVEATRKAGKKAFWWGDTFTFMMSHTMMGALKTNNHTLLICVAERELKRWQNLGFIDSGLRGQVPSKWPTPWAAMSIDLHALWRGRLGFEPWRQLIASVAHQLPVTKRPKISTWDRIRLTLFRSVFRLMRPLAPRREATARPARIH